MMKINIRSIKSTKKIIEKLLLELYKNEVIDTDMEPSIIGLGLEYASQDDWMESRLRGMR